MAVETSVCIGNPVKQFLMSYLYQTKLILEDEDKIIYLKIKVSIEVPRSFLESVQYSGNKKTPYKQGTVGLCTYTKNDSPVIKIAGSRTINATTWAHIKCTLQVKQNCLCREP